MTARFKSGCTSLPEGIFKNKDFRGLENLLSRRISQWFDGGVSLVFKVWSVEYLHWNHLGWLSERQVPGPSPDLPRAWVCSGRAWNVGITWELQLLFPEHSAGDDRAGGFQVCLNSGWKWVGQVGVTAAPSCVADRSFRGCSLSSFWSLGFQG